MDGGDDSGQGVDSGNPGDSGDPGDAGNDSATPVSCDGGLMACGQQCVDTSTDTQNCGGCGVVCNTQCVGGVCQLLGNQCDGRMPCGIFGGSRSRTGTRTANPVAGR